MGWTLFFMMVILKIPLLAALYLIWWAVKAPEPEPDAPGGEQRKPRRRPPSFPRSPRRGPAGGAGCLPPPCPQRAEKPLSRRGPAVARRD